MSEAAARDALRAAGFAGPYACAVVTGTGLGGIAAALTDARAVDYAAIPGFPGPGVSGHGGQLHRGRLAGRPVLIFEGRAHAYERGDPAAMRMPLACAACPSPRPSTTPPCGMPSSGSPRTAA